MSHTKEQIMEQAQVYASAWSLVGSPFDGGDGADRANDEKAILRRMIHETITVQCDFEIRKHPEGSSDYRCGCASNMTLLQFFRCEVDSIKLQRDELLAALESEIPLAAESVLSYLYALNDEAKSRGGMFPQCSDEHESDSSAIHRVAGLVRWYAENGRGYPSTDAVRALMLARARNSGRPAPTFAAIASVKGGA